MKFSEKVKTIKLKYDLENRQLANILGLSNLRVEELLSEKRNPTKYEKIKVERLLKLKIMIEKPMSLDELMQEQKETIESIKKSIMDKVGEKLFDDKVDQIREYIEDILVESMYLGLMYANNNEDETVLKIVRRRRIK
jgi:transcriptional regulator with XRE-family HTH domain